MSEIGLLLGLDGGGQATQAVFATQEGSILGRGIGPPSNFHRVGVDSARRAVRTAIESAFTQACVQQPALASVSDSAHAWIRDSGIRAAWLGLSGISDREDESIFSSWLRGLGCMFKLAVGNNSELILGGGTPEGWGVALISSTGSICCGRAPGRRGAVRVGGWGHVLGDEGSGYQMSTEALKLATQAADERGGSPVLLEAALKHWGLNQPKDLIGFICRPETTAEDVAAFAARVLDLALTKDADAVAIVDRAAIALASQVESVVAKLAIKKPPLALGGAMMREPLKGKLLDRVKSPLGPISVVTDPVLGAIANARRL